MRKILFCILTLAILVITFATAKAIEEKDLTPERSKTLEKKPAITFMGYVNSKNVVLIGGVMGVTYYFCKESKSDFCSDQEGILIVSGSDVGRVPEMLKILDNAIEGKDRILVKLSANGDFMGIREIFDVQRVNTSI